VPTIFGEETHDGKRMAVVDGEEEGCVTTTWVVWVP